MSAVQINVARIIEEMKRHGWGVAATAVNVGVNNKTLAKILNGEMPKRLDAFYRLIDGLKSPIDEALYGGTPKAATGKPVLVYRRRENFKVN